MIAYQPAPLGGPPPPALQQAASNAWVAQIAQVCNLTQQGKLNATIEITLAASVVSTTLTDARISFRSFIAFMPLTASAAAEIAAGTMYVSAQTTGQATITHANSAAADRRFRLLIIA